MDFVITHTFNWLFADFTDSDKNWVYLSTNVFNDIKFGSNRDLLVA